MILKIKKISKIFIILIIGLVIIFSLSWFYWSNIKVLIFGGEYQAIIVPLSKTVIDKDLKQKIISKLGQLRQYGEWPVIISIENPNRGDPFQPKQ